MESDFMARYRSINAKLKKRLLRKPNFAEGAAEFASLAKELENQECPHYAAFCLLAAARCEHAVGNNVYEADDYIRAARLFLEKEKESHDLLCPSYHEHLNAAIQAYTDAIKVHLDNDIVSLAASLYLELAENLKYLGRTQEAIPYLFEAAKLHKSCPLDYLNDLKEISEYRLKVGDHHGALTTLTEMQALIEKRGFHPNGQRIGAFSELLTFVEVTRVLLLCLLQPPDFKINPEHKKLLDRYLDPNSEPVDYIDDDLYITLQSLVMCIKERDFRSLKELDADLWPYLNGFQCDLLLNIIEHLKDMAIKVPCIRL